MSEIDLPDLCWMTWQLHYKSKFEDNFLFLLTYLFRLPCSVLFLSLCSCSSLTVLCCGCVWCKDRMVCIRLFGWSLCFRWLSSCALDCVFCVFSVQTKLYNKHPNTTCHIMNVCFIVKYFSYSY